MVKQLPLVGVDDNGDVSIEQTPEGEVHVFAHPTEPVTVHQRDTHTGKVISSGEVAENSLVGHIQGEYKKWPVCISPIIPKSEVDRVGQYGK